MVHLYGDTFRDTRQIFNFLIYIHMYVPSLCHVYFSTHSKSRSVIRLSLSLSLSLSFSL